MNTNNDTDDPMDRLDFGGFKETAQKQKEQRENWQRQLEENTIKPREEE